MRKIFNIDSGVLERVLLDPGEVQYLSSTNLKAVAPEAYKKVKDAGAKRWLERVKRGDTGLHSKSVSTKDPLQAVNMSHLRRRTRR